MLGIVAVGAVGLVGRWWCKEPALFCWLTEENVERLVVWYEKYRHARCVIFLAAQKCFWKARARV